MQYWKPEDAELHVGDCLPFDHDGVFRFFYLLDRGHHKSRGGPGERRTLVVRYPERRGERVALFARNADVGFRDVEVRPLL